MHFEGSVPIKAPRADVWAFVTDPRRVGRCGPGVESVEVIDATHFRAAARVGAGFLRATFSVDMELAEQEPPERATLKAHGQAPGSTVDATATMDLSDGPDGTTLMAWTADIDLSGAMAGVGRRMIEGVANRMIGQTFDCMRSTLER